MINLHLGDCLAVLRTLPDNSVDSVVTDPPYGLSKEPDMMEVMRHWLNGDDYTHTGKGFMGKSWDSFVPGPAVWKECLRVLKPGGHLVAFFGSRTYDMGTLTVRMAGFEIRDQLMWIYGCLSDDTEVLTEQGFMRYDHIRKSTNIRIFTYDKDADSYGLEQPERWNEYQIQDTCYRIESATTDQLVSRNHRCLVEREGNLVFEFAENLAPQQQAHVPILEGLPALQFAISDAYQRAGASQQDLQPFVQTCVDWQGQRGAEINSEKAGGCSLRSVWQSDQQAGSLAKAGCQPNLQPPLQRSFEGQRVGYPCSQGAGELVGSERTGAQSSHDGVNESGLERGHHVSQEERLLRSGINKVCTLPGAVPTNGPEGRVRDGVSFGDGSADWAMPDAGGSCSSYRSQPDEQPHIESDVVCQQQRSQKVRSGASYSTTLATITPVHYDGLVFCPTVSTGAFIARRNGKVFLTGNSGFPKSLDVSKAIDKAAGAERQVVGSKLGRPGYSLTDGQPGGVAMKGNVDGSLRNGTAECAITAPATDEAAQWQGWGTALKPAHEPIVLARKPLAGTVAQTVLTHGTGAINVDGCRIEFAGDADQQGATWGRGTDIIGGNYVGATHSSGHTNIEANLQGRFPANVLHDGSDEVLATFYSFGSKPSKHNQYSAANSNNRGSGLFGDRTQGATYGDTGSAARFFYCAKADRSDRDEGCRNLANKQGGMVSNTSGQHITRRDEGYAPGKVKNHHPTVKPTDLMQWLCRLVTPPGGMVLDPYMGSGTTGKAAVKEGFSFTGIELEPEYYDIASTRIHHAHRKYGKQQSLFV